ncbi:DUF4262 domain-containing protein [Hymenobacter sp. UV11]|uniref:DUF4262 domain-containing protein n=1 Tax=Hymenobacter sp. UV11 TaxID=1849735 RepID=UPI00105C8F17|nr:DUF4262 domain-containing protein [Hymenobacter sp. UV11]TDN39896.1 hypothetical protein A8B98_16465 [Hymenobacter sp. UV11]TFZ62857.1 DUF4262 domain-containing protein [Hymenobacter sp. UV11]
MLQRSDLLARIRSNIDKFGYHITVVTGGALPRFAYTIGCTTTLSAEFIFAGGEFYSQSQVSEILAATIAVASTEADWPTRTIRTDSLGCFSLVKVHPSWAELLALGAFDYYNQPTLSVWQVVPDFVHHTVDVPVMVEAFDEATQPVWQWLTRQWEYPIPADSMAVTNLLVLAGAKATEVMRWEEDDWEIFAGTGPDIPKADMRIVPFGTLLGIDASLKVAIDLKVGKGVWRDPLALDWQPWG